MSSGARLLPVACCWEPRRGYYVHSSPPIELQLTGNRGQDVLHNARRVLAVFEGALTPQASDADAEGLLRWKGTNPRLRKEAA